MIDFSIPYIYIIGSYKRSKTIETYCNILGNHLAEYNIGIISSGSKPGLKIAEFLDANLSDSFKEIPERILFVYRKRPTSKFIKVRRIGCSFFIGNNTSEMKEFIFSRAKIVISIGGGLITREEILIAQENKIPIIPVAMSGGTSLDIWNKLQKIKNEYSDNFRDLNSKNPYITVIATIKIIKKLLLIDVATRIKK